jgi:hypothetical protein
MWSRPVRNARVPDEPGEQEAGVGVGADCAWRRGRRLAGHRQVDQIQRRESPPATAVSHRLQDWRLGEEVRQSAGVIQQLPQSDGGAVGTPRAVTEPVDDVAGEIATCWIVESAVA